MNTCYYIGCYRKQLDENEYAAAQVGMCSKCNRRFIVEAGSSQPQYTNILQEAHVITEGARDTDYGSALESFSRIATVAAILCNKQFSAQDVAKVLMAMKLVRESNKHKRDNLVDLCGYARLLQDIEDALANMEPNCKPS